MFEYAFLQQYWWFIISLLGGLLVFLMFVQGANAMIFSLGRTEAERTMLVNSTGRKWEFTFTTLVTFGGAFFASFPLFYSTSFGGAYWVWMLILLCFVLQAVSYEYQAKKGNLLGKKTYQVFLIINGIVAPLLIGTAVGTFFTGADFQVNKEHLTDLSMPIISTWMNPLHGLEAALNIWNLFLGLALVYLSRVLGLLYYINNIDDAEIYATCHRRMKKESSGFLIFFLIFVFYLFVADGFAVNPDTQEVYKETGKYLHNFLAMPGVLLVFLAGVVLVLFGIGKTILKEGYRRGIWFAGIGTILTVLALLLCVGWNNTPYYPSNVDLQSSLTIANSCSSPFTLKVMSFVSILIPFVLAYIFYAWRAIDLRGINRNDLEHDSHMY